MGTPTQEQLPVQEYAGLLVPVLRQLWAEFPRRSHRLLTPLAVYLGRSLGAIPQFLGRREN